VEYHQSLIYLGGLVAAFIMLSFIVVWVIGLAMKDSSIVDIWFSPCLGIAAVIGWQIGGGAEDRSLLVMVLALLWSARLGGYGAKKTVAMRVCVSTSSPRARAMRSTVSSTSTSTRASRS
jgi:steroid 5-alpha reductase family enzyme